MKFNRVAVFTKNVAELIKNNQHFAASYNYNLKKKIYKIICISRFKGPQQKLPHRSIRIFCDIKFS